MKERTIMLQIEARSSASTNALRGVRSIVVKDANGKVIEGMWVEQIQVNVMQKGPGKLPPPPKPKRRK